MRAVLKTRALLVTLTLSACASRGGDVDPPDLATSVDQCSLLATHNSYCNPNDGIRASLGNQPNSIIDQLDYGVRVINPDLWLIRQKRIGNPLLGTCKWIFESYTGGTTKLRDSRLEGRPVEVVMAHGNESPSAAFLQPCTPWKSFKGQLVEIREWIEAHTNSVIWVVPENKISKTMQHYVTNAIEDSGIGKYVFYLDRFNPDVPAPEERPHGWAVGRYGMPTFQHLVNHKKTVILMAYFQWSYEVATVFGDDSLDPDTWTNVRTESEPASDFNRRGFSYVHAPNLPTGQDYAKVNWISQLNDKMDDIQARWNRLPTTVWVDYYNRGAKDRLVGPPGPAEFVNQLNARWKALPEITGVAQVSPDPSAYGWHNTDVDVALSSEDDIAQAFTSCEFHGRSEPYPTGTRKYHLDRQGLSTIAYTAVGNLGKRSPLKMLDVRIDKVQPTITCTLEPPPNANGWNDSAVTAHFSCSDSLSGVAECPSDVVLESDGRNQSVTGVTRDRANNQSIVTITNINIDTKGPVICAAQPEALWPPNGKPALVVITGTITDAGSGVDPTTLNYSVTDEYHETEPSGSFKLVRKQAFAFTLRLEAKRRGNDRDGRRYVVHLNASDLAGHPTEQTLTITVPHDRGKDEGPAL